MIKNETEKVQRFDSSIVQSPPGDSSLTRREALKNKASPEHL